MEYSQERPGGTGGGPEDDGGWNTVRRDQVVQVEDLRMMVGGIQERPGGTGGEPEDDGGWNTVRRDQVVQVEDLRMMVGGIQSGETRWYRWRT